MSRTLARSAPHAATHATHTVQPAHRDAAAERDRSAFNAAFHELGLRWQWDEATYEALVAQPCERERLRRYLAQEQAHLLRAYDAEFLTDAILAVKSRRRAEGIAAPTLTVMQPTAPRRMRSDAPWDVIGF